MCFFVDKIGRRKLFLTSTIGMLVSFIVWTICSARYAIAGNHAAAQAVIAMIFIYYVFYNMAYSGLLVGYTAEILPYNIRAKGITVTFLAVDIARKFRQYNEHLRTSLTDISSSVLQSIYQSYRTRSYWLEVLHLLLRLAWI